MPPGTHHLSGDTVRWLRGQNCSTSGSPCPWCWMEQQAPRSRPLALSALSTDTLLQIQGQETRPPGSGRRVSRLRTPGLTPGPARLSRKRCSPAGGSAAAVLVSVGSQCHAPRPRSGSLKASNLISAGWEERVSGDHACRVGLPRSQRQ